MDNQNLPLNMLRDIINYNPGICYIIQLEPEIKFVFVNDMVQNLTGYSPQEHYQDPDLGNKLLDPTSSDALKNGVQAALNGDSAPFLLKWRKKSGEVLWTQQQLVKYIYDGRLHIIGYAQDVTDRETIKMELDKIRKFTNICAYCNRIYHENKWKDFEKYLSDSSKTELTHGACPICADQELKKLSLN